MYIYIQQLNLIYIYIYIYIYIEKFNADNNLIAKPTLTWSQDAMRSVQRVDKGRRTSRTSTSSQLEETRAAVLRRHNRRNRTATVMRIPLSSRRVTPNQAAQCCGDRLPRRADNADLRWPPHIAGNRARMFKLQRLRTLLHIHILKTGLQS